jgi:hypothetical protein
VQQLRIEFSSWKKALRAAVAVVWVRHAAVWAIAPSLLSAGAVYRKGKGKVGEVGGRSAFRTAAYGWAALGFLALLGMTT